MISATHSILFGLSDRKELDRTDMKPVWGRGEMYKSFGGENWGKEKTWKTQE